MGTTWIANLAVAACAAAWTAVSSAPSVGPKESFDTVAWRVAHAVRAGDYRAFARDAAPAFTIEERWRAYDVYFTRAYPLKKMMLGTPDETMISSVTRVVTAAPRANDRKLFSSFGATLREAWTYDPDEPYGTPTLIGRFGAEGAESIDSSSPAIGSVIASNLDWAIELEQIDGRWVARRLVMMGH